MIEYNSKVWLRHVFDFHKIDTFRALFPEMILVAGYTAVIVLLERYFSETWTDVDLLRSLGSITTMHSLLGFIISMLLVFRTNSAYERWWEARKHWGALVNASRNLAIKLRAFLGETPPAEREYLAGAIGDFPVALKDHLRGAVRPAALEQFHAAPTAEANALPVPQQIVLALYHRMQGYSARGALAGEKLLVIDRDLAALVDILGACERIRNTPIPYSYNIFIKKFIFFYIATLPIGFAALFHYWAIPLISFLFYVLVSLEVIAEEIEDPFGTDPNDLPTDRLAEMIRRNVRDILCPDGGGETREAGR